VALEADRLPTGQHPAAAAAAEDEDDGDHTCRRTVRCSDETRLDDAAESVDLWHTIANTRYKLVFLVSCVVDRLRLTIRIMLGLVLVNSHCIQHFQISN